jgi:hypothetical protein
LLLGGDASPTFAIGADAYSGIISPTLQFFRLQRCGDTALALHGSCHRKDGIAAGGSWTARLWTQPAAGTTPALQALIQKAAGG